MATTKVLKDTDVKIGGNVLHITAAKDLLNFFYPIGTIYETTSNSLDTVAKMNNHFGGIWETYGNGRVTVAKDSGTFKTIGAYGGAETHILSENELPDVPYRANPNVQHAGGWFTGSGTKFALTEGNGYLISAAPNLGQGSAHNNLQPYIVVHRYRRIS